MKRSLLTISILAVCINIFPQDTIKVFLDGNHAKTTEEKAKFVRKAVCKDHIIYLTEDNVKGQRVFYCEFNSSNPSLEQGRAIYYTDKDSVYSTGNYNNGEMTGKWLYYKKDMLVDTIDYSFKNNFDIKRNWHSVEYYKNSPLLRSLGNRVYDSISSYIHANFHLPGRVKIDDIAGISLWIDCIIDSDGRIKFAVINNSAYRDVDKEICRILNQFHYEVKTNRPFLLHSVPF
jgi:hypothetical protein